MDRQTALERLNQDLANRPGLLDACARAVKYLAEQPSQALRRISFGLLGQAAGLSTSLEAVSVADYLSSGRLHLLDKQYVLIVDDEEFEISLDDANEAKRSNVYFHPEKGEVIKNVSEHLYLFFIPSSMGKEVFGGPTE